MDTNELHVHQFRETVVPPTCREPGYSIYTCDCGYEHKTNFKPIAGHTFQITQTTPAGCTEPGVITSTCTTCGVSNTRTVAPLGHQFGNWIIQKYPTCQEQGMQVRKCQRCAVQEESILPPTGHRPAPQTAQYANGRVASFFCENCGQTVVVPPLVVQPPVQRTGNYFPTRILLMIYTVTAFLYLMFDILTTLDYGGLNVSNLLGYIYPAVYIGFGIVFFFAVDKIKTSPRFPRWLGIVPAALVLHYVASMVLWHGLYFSLQLVIDILRIASLLFLMILFFCGVKRKKWLFVTVLSCAVPCILLQTISMMQIISWYALGDGWPVSNWYLPYQIAACSCMILRLVCWILLVTPAKNLPVQPPRDQMPIA